MRYTCVVVVDGWFKQPQLARVRLIELWGWVRLHTCRVMQYHGTQVKPAFNHTHTSQGLNDKKKNGIAVSMGTGRTISKGG